MSFKKCERKFETYKNVAPIPCRNFHGVLCKMGGIKLNMKTLKTVNTGESVTVLKLEGEGATKRRIMDMGITKGSTVVVKKVAPLGDPIEITVRGYELSLRKADAEKIIVE